MEAAEADKLITAADLLLTKHDYESAIELIPVTKAVVNLTLCYQKTGRYQDCLDKGDLAKDLVNGLKSGPLKRKLATRIQKVTAEAKTSLESTLIEASKLEYELLMDQGDFLRAEELLQAFETRGYQEEFDLARCKFNLENFAGCITTCDHAWSSAKIYDAPESFTTQIVELKMIAMAQQRELDKQTQLEPAVLAPSVSPSEAPPQAPSENPLEIFTKLNDKPLNTGDTWYVLDQLWMKSWKAWVKGKKGTPPGSIDNSRIVEKLDPFNFWVDLLRPSLRGNVINPAMMQNKDFRVITSEAYAYLRKKFAADPDTEISRSVINVDEEGAYK